MAEGGEASEVGRCNQCREPIPTGARLCRHCHSFQDWRGRLNLSSTVLALLVALVSVLSVTLPAVISALEPTVSRVVLSNPVVRGETLYVVASNQGNRPGVIQRGKLVSRYLGDGPVWLDVASPTEAFVAPGAKQVGLAIRLQLNSLATVVAGLGIVLEQRDGREVGGTAIIWTVQSNGQITESTLPIRVEDISSVLGYHAERCGLDVAVPTFENGCMSRQELTKAIVSRGMRQRRAENGEAGPGRPAERRR